jgi:hypothetical protein
VVELIFDDIHVVTVRGWALERKLEWTAFLWFLLLNYSSASQHCRSQYLVHVFFLDFDDVVLPSPCVVVESPMVLDWVG